MTEERRTVLSHAMVLQGGERKLVDVQVELTDRQTMLEQSQSLIKETNEYDERQKEILSQVEGMTKEKLEKMGTTVLWVYVPLHQLNIGHQ